MSLHFPSDAECLVPECGRKPITHQFSVRMRRKDTGADWAPNVPAYFCDFHANSGAKVTILYEPHTTGVVEVEAYAVKLGGAHRNYEIP